MINLFFASLSLIYYVNSPVINIREESKCESEIVSQAYFFKEVNIIEETENFVKSETTIDHHQGWIQKSLLCQRNETFLLKPSKTTAKVNRCAADLYAIQDTVCGLILTTL